MVLHAVEDVLNAAIDAEADEQCGAGRYERSGERRSTRAGHYDRQVTTKSGPVAMLMPKLRDLRFSTAVFERWQRRETSPGGNLRRAVPGRGFDKTRTR